MQLIIAEKYSVAQAFAKILGCTERHTEHHKGNVGYLQSKDGEWCVTWAAGHVVEMVMPDGYDPKFKSWNMNLLPIVPQKWKYTPATHDPAKSQWKVLKELINRADVTDIYHAADADREGELIGREILREAGAPRDKTYWRLWYTNNTPAALQRAIDDRKPLIEYRDLGAAADCRQKLDWLFGINMTRAFTAYAHDTRNVGRVVSPAINLIVERQREIDNFVPEDYATITVPVKRDENEFKAEARFEDIPKAEALAKTLKGKDAVIRQVERSTDKETRKLYDATSLQAEAADRFGYEPEATMKIMQELYDQGFMSYPRTNSNTINEDQIDETKDLPAMAWEKVFGKPSQADPAEFDIMRIVGKKGKGAEASHTGLTPTDIGIASYQSKIKGNEKQRNIFLLVTLRLVCSVMPPRIVDKTKLDIEIENEMFKASGSVETDPGFMDLERYVKSNLSSKKKKKTSAVQVLPEGIEVGDVYTCMTAKCAKKQTKPPKQYTTASLMTTMKNISRVIKDKKMKELLKEAGLGTQASRPDTVAKIKKNGFVETRGGYLYPTEKAFVLMELLPDDVKSPIMTGQMELQLDAIARGDANGDDFLRDTIKRVVDEVEKVRALPPIPDKERYAHNKVFVNDACPKCGAHIVEDDRTMVCQCNCGFKVWRTIAKKKITKEELKHMLEHGHTSKKIEGLKSAKGNEFSCWLYIDGSYDVKFDFSDDGNKAKTQNIVALRAKSGQ